MAAGYECDSERRPAMLPAVRTVAERCGTGTRWLFMPNENDKSRARPQTHGADG
jgi:hypothetical protein